MNSFQSIASGKGILKNDFGDEEKDTKDKLQFEALRRRNVHSSDKIATEATKGIKKWKPLP